LLSAIPTGVGPTPFALSIPLASLIMIEANHHDAVSLDSGLSFAPSSSSAPYPSATKGGPLIAMLDSAATQQGTLVGGMMTVVNASADNLDEGAVPPYLVVATPVDGSSFATASGGKTRSGSDVGLGTPSDAGGIGTTPFASGGSSYGGIGAWGPASWG
jgi:hypothetical protein